MHTAQQTRNEKHLRNVKLLHTVIWAFFASCILAIPFFAWTEQFGIVLVLAALVMIEVLVLVVNAWRCPLTLVAERYTDERRDNFDIYLPLWLARHNKSVFGLLFIAGLVLALFRWLL